MYTMVLMMAATTGGDTASFGLLRGSCHGSCHGARVVASAPASSCTGMTVATPVSSCTGSTVAAQNSSCNGPSLMNRLKAKFTRNSCHGNTATASSCTGSTVSAPVASCGGCDVAAPVAIGMVTSDCPPASAVVGGTVVVPATTPAVMPKPEPKKVEPKKDEPKKKMD